MGRHVRHFWKLMCLAAHSSLSINAVEERFRAEGKTAIRTGVLVANTEAQPFWAALGYRQIDLRPDRAKGRPTLVMEKLL